MRSLLLLAAVLSLSLSGCRIIYRTDVSQGNLLDQQMVESLKPGMTKRQVALVMGSPSVHSPFHDDRWDYLSSQQHRGGKIATKNLTLFFENDVLTRFEGDYFGKQDDALLKEARRIRGREEDPDEAVPKSRKKDRDRGG